MNRLTAQFQFALNHALNSENRDDLIVHLRTMNDVFTQAVIFSDEQTSLRKSAETELRTLESQKIVEKAKAEAHDDILAQYHLLASAQVCRESDPASQKIFSNMKNQVRQNLQKTEDYYRIRAKCEISEKKIEKMDRHVAFLSRKCVMHQMACRFYARELAALRQMMDLLTHAPTVELAVKSDLWQQIAAESRVLRLNTLKLVDRINNETPTGDHIHEPRLIILMRKSMNQGLGLEIVGGSSDFRPIVVTAKLKNSMSDDDQLMLNDRILAIDGTFVTSSMTHSQVSELLLNEQDKDFIAMIVSQFDPSKLPNTSTSRIDY